MLQIIFILMGTFVGAGFASGKEVFNFFTIFSYAGLFSIFLFAFFLFLLIKNCMTLKINLNIKKYNDLLSYFDHHFSFFNRSFFSFFIHIFLSTSFYTMLSAMSSLFQNQFNIARIITTSIALLICFFIFLKNNLSFIYTINSILMPFLFLLLFFIFFRHTAIQKISFLSLPSFLYGKGIIMGLFYFSYNSLLLIPILFNINLQEKTNSIFKISFLFSSIIFGITFLLNILLTCHYSTIATADLPLLQIVSTDSSFFLFLYFFMFLSAIFTTMISSGFSFIHNLNKKYYYLKLLLFLGLSFFFSFFSFSALINFFYPLFGLLGFFQLILLFLSKHLKKT